MTIKNRSFYKLLPFVFSAHYKSDDNGDTTQLQNKCVDFYYNYLKCNESNYLKVDNIIKSV